MGVPLFYKRLIEARFGEVIKKTPPRCSVLAIDFAGIAHNIVKYLNTFQGEDWGVGDYENMLNIELKYLLETIKPQRLFILCMDGIAPIGKINQQRKRRFRYELERVEKAEESSGFNTNKISPGTDFSVSLDKMIQTFLTRNKTLLPDKTIYSPHTVDGEGEHKIVDLIKNLNPEEEIVFLGSDADIILLSLPLAQKITICRYEKDINQEKIDKNKEETEKKGKNFSMRYVMSKPYFFKIRSNYVSITRLREKIKAMDIDINSFIFAASIFGNDFIPPLIGFHLIGDVTAEFLEALQGKEFFPLGKINFPLFREFLIELIPAQEKMIPIIQGKNPPINSNDTVNFPSKLKIGKDEKFIDVWDRQLLHSSVIPYGETLESKDGSFEIPSIEESLDEISIDYFKTLIWSFHYYKSNKDVNWNWAYWNHWSPSIESLTNIESLPMKKYKDVLEKKGMGFNLLGQLLLILPRDLKTNGPNPILPKEAQDLQIDSSPIFDFYPSYFRIIKEGVRHNYDGITFLPPLDIDRFVWIFQRLFPQDSKFMKKTQYEGVDTVITQNPRELYIPKGNIIEGKKTYIFKLTDESETIKEVSEVMGYENAKKVYFGKRLFPQMGGINRVDDFKPIKIIEKEL